MNMAENKEDLPLVDVVVKLGEVEVFFVQSGRPRHFVFYPALIAPMPQTWNFDLLSISLTSNALIMRTKIDRFFFVGNFRVEETAV